MATHRSCTNQRGRRGARKPGISGNRDGSGPLPPGNVPNIQAQP